MKVRLLRKWNRLLDSVYAVDATFNMSLFERLYYLWLLVSGNIRYCKDALHEFNGYHAEYHYLGYDVGPGICMWELYKRGIPTHDGNVNAWSVFSNRYRRFSSKYCSPDAIIARVVKTGKKF